LVLRNWSVFSSPFYSNKKKTWPNNAQNQPLSAQCDVSTALSSWLNYSQAEVCRSRAAAASGNRAGGTFAMPGQSFGFRSANAFFMSVGRRKKKEKKEEICHI
jgi:hypothetical protein